MTRKLKKYETTMVMFCKDLMGSYPTQEQNEWLRSLENSTGLSQQCINVLLEYSYYTYKSAFVFTDIYAKAEVLAKYKGLTCNLLIYTIS